MTGTSTKTGKAAGIEVMRCLSPDCGGLLAYEIDARGFLYVDLRHTARTNDGVAYLPCPRCGGKNVLETAEDSAGKRRPRVARFAP